MVSDFPEADVMGLTAMSIELRCQDASTAKEILESIIRAEPLSQYDVSLPLPHLKDSWRMNKALYSQLPIINWNQLYNLNLAIPMTKNGKAIRE